MTGLVAPLPNGAAHARSLEVHPNERLWHPGGTVTLTWPAAHSRPRHEGLPRHGAGQWRIS